MTGGQLDDRSSWGRCRLADEVAIAIIAALSAVLASLLTALASIWLKKREIRHSLLGNLVKESYDLILRFYGPMADIAEDIERTCEYVRDDGDRQQKTLLLFYQIVRFYGIQANFQSAAGKEFRFRDIQTETFVEASLHDVQFRLPFSDTEISFLADLAKNLPSFHVFAETSVKDPAVALLVGRVTEWVLDEDSEFSAFVEALDHHDSALVLGINELYGTWYRTFSGYRWPSRYGRFRRKLRRELEERYGTYV